MSNAATSRLHFRKPSLMATAFLLDLPLVLVAVLIGLDDTIAYAAYAVVDVVRDLSFVDLRPSLLSELAGSVAVASAIAGGVVARVAIRRDGTGAGWLLGGLPFFMGIVVGLWFLIYVLAFATFEGWL